MGILFCFCLSPFEHFLFFRHTGDIVQVYPKNLGLFNIILLWSEQPEQGTFCNETNFVLNEFSSKIRVLFSVSSIKLFFFHFPSSICLNFKVDIRNFPGYCYFRSLLTWRVHPMLNVLECWSQNRVRYKFKIFQKCNFP